MDGHYFILALLLGALVLFAMEKIRADIVAMLVMAVLILTDTVTINEGFSGFSNPAVITVIAMFILSAGLERTGVADFLGRLMMKVAGNNTAWLTAVVMLTVGAMSAFMNNIGATVVLITPIYAICRKLNYPPAKLLIPLSFGSLMGGLTTLIGTPPNLLVSIALEEHGFRGFKMFDFLPTGLAVLGVGVLYMVFIGRHLIPARTGGEDLTTAYHLDAYITEVSIPAESSLAGVQIGASSVIKEIGLIILRVTRTSDGQDIELAPGPDTRLMTGDRLLIEGNLEKLFKVIESKDLIIHIKTKISDENLTGKNIQLAEVVPSPKSPILGQSIRQADIKRRYGVLALALRKREKTFAMGYTDQPLEMGDVMLVQGTPERLREVATHDDFLVINHLEPKIRDLKKAPYAIAAMGFAILTAATGILHISIAGIVGVLLMALTGSVQVKDIYKKVEWRVVFLIACMMPLGIAMDSDHTGTAEWIAMNVVKFSGDYGPYVVLGCLLIFVTLITEVMSNAAAAVLLAPIGISIAVGMNLEPYPFLMAIAIGASTTFLSPIGHQANVLVYGIGGYKFTDFPRTGVWLNILIAILTILLVPVVWPFTPLNS
jgi:di/tricarboxylate transporter